MLKIIEFLRQMKDIPLDKEDILMLFLLKDEFMPRSTMKSVFKEDDKWIDFHVTKLLKEGYIKKTGRGNIFSLSKRGNDTVKLLMDEIEAPLSNFFPV